MTEQIYKIIEKINKEIGAVPVEKDGSYSPQNRMFVLGLYEAKEVVEKVAKEEKYEKRLRVLADVLSGCPLNLACDKLWEPHGWCMKHCSENQLEPDAECWLKYAEEVAKEAEQ